MNRRSLMVAALMAGCVSTVSHGEVLSSKRGFADVGANYEYLQATGAGWYYTWGLGEASPGNFDADFAPMFWGDWAVNQGNIDAVKNNSDVEWVLGFNEPEREDQADLSVDAAVSAWRTLSAGFEGTDKKLVTPAVSDTSAGKAWMSEFRDAVVAEDLKVDAVAFHWYGWSTPHNINQAAANFMGSVNWYHNLWNKPVFITEFAIHDWSGTYSAEEISEANRQFLDIVIPQLESLSWVEGYAWYHWFSDAHLFEGSPSAPTEMAYEHTGVLESGDVYDFSTVDHGEHAVYLAGGELTHGGGATGQLRYISALSSTSELSADVAWSLEDGGWLRVAEGARLRMTGDQTLSVGNGSIGNEGVLEVVDGTLAVNGIVTGGGVVIVGPDGGETTASLVLDGDPGLGQFEADGTGVGMRFGNSIGFRGRENDSAAVVNKSGRNTIEGRLTLEYGGTSYRLRSDAGTLILSGSSAEAGGVSITTYREMGPRVVTLDGAGDGEIHGVIRSLGDTTLSIEKTGLGRWTLGGENAYTGTTTVLEGTLVVDGRTGSGLTRVEGGAVLGGHGVVAGDLEAASGSVVRVGGAGLPEVSLSGMSLIDDFDGYPVGDIGAVPNSTGDVWTGVFNGTANADIVSDGGDRALSVLGTGSGSGWRGAVTDLVSDHGEDFSLADGETGTYFFRLRRNGTGSIDTILGLTDQAATTDSAPGNDIDSPWNEYAVLLSVFGDTDSSYLRAYSEGSGDVNLSPVGNGSWLNVWLTVDQEDKTFRVATSTGESEGVDSGGVYSYGRRTGSTVGGNPLVTFGLHGARTTELAFDDFYFTEGVDLSLPFAGFELEGETLTVSGDLMLDSASSLMLDAGSASVHDRLVVGGTLRAGGVLEVSVDSWLSSPVGGEVFDLMDFGSVEGTFEALMLPELGNGLVWDASSLLVDGELVVALMGMDGDFNGDGVLGAADLDLLVLEMVMPTGQGVFDLDGSDVVDDADLTVLVEALLGTRRGDANLDGRVDLLDLSLLASHFGDEAGWSGGNFNGDATVDLLDLSLLASSFGFDGTAVPEPLSVVMMGLGAGVMLRRG